MYMKIKLMNTPSPIQLQKQPPSLQEPEEQDDFEDKKAYEKTLKKWQRRMLVLQQAYFHQKHRALIVFEGWDASGKGGSIRRLTEKMDPRGFTVYPFSAPTPEEQGVHYLYRFQKCLPRRGTMSIFDRSYYGRVLVERIEGFAKKDEWQRAYQEINEFERLLMDDDMRVIKLFLHISPEEQLQRFAQRLEDPIKRWKLTEEDLRNRKKWPDYEEAIHDMFHNTSTEKAPWHIIPANSKWHARIAVLKTIVLALEAGIDTTPPPLDKSLIKAAKKQLGLEVSD